MLKCESTGCDYGSKSKEDLQNHIKSNHIELKDELTDKEPNNSIPDKNRPFRCVKCNRCFSQKVNLKRHIESVHEGIKPLKCHKCDICDYKTAKKTDLKRHIESVHEGIKPYKCNICAFETARKGNLKNHIVSVHEGIKQFKCNICEFKTGQKREL